MGAQYSPIKPFSGFGHPMLWRHVVAILTTGIFFASDGKITKEGLWEATIANVAEYAHYQYAILTKDKKWIYKSDPFSFHSELRPKVASKVYNLDNYRFQDHEWMEQRKKNDHHQKPMNIYEVHLGSWRRYADGNVFDYRKLGDELSKYAKEMGYTHLEIMPIYEYPLTNPGVTKSPASFADFPLRDAGRFQSFCRYLPPSRHRGHRRLVPGHFARMPTA